MGGTESISRCTIPQHAIDLEKSSYFVSAQNLNAYHVLDIASLPQKDHHNVIGAFLVGPMFGVTCKTYNANCPGVGVGCSVRLRTGLRLSDCSCVISGSVLFLFCCAGLSLTVLFGLVMPSVGRLLGGSMCRSSLSFSAFLFMVCFPLSRARSHLRSPCPPVSSSEG